MATLTRGRRVKCCPMLQYLGWRCAAVTGALCCTAAALLLCCDYPRHRWMGAGTGRMGLAAWVSVFCLVTAPAAQHHQRDDAAQLQPHGSHFRGMKREELVEPMPGRPCLTGL